MKPSSKKQENTLRIAIIMAAVLSLLLVAFFVLIPENNTDSGDVVIPKKEIVSTKTTVTEDPSISEDSIRREMEREIEGCAKEQVRFAKVLKEASDEELFVMLNYAIAHHYVPNRDIDPFYNVHLMVGCWQRSLMVYDNLSDRKDLLRKIYPDLKVLDEYVHWGRQSGQPYPDTIVSKTIMDNAKKECQCMDHRLISKYFSTPLMHD